VRLPLGTLNAGIWVDNVLSVNMSMADHRSEREQEKTEAVEAIEHALATIEGQRREPDKWERLFLVQAIGWLFRGGYRLAAVDAELALTPVSERSRASSIRPDPFLDRCNVSLLRQAYQEAAAQPLTDFPAFGPVIFRGQ
jgi:hypothetical protein